MEADWDEVNTLAFAAQPGHDFQTTTACAMAFDSSQELLWLGNNTGRVSSYMGPKLQPYTAFVINERGDGPVRQILIHEKGIICLGPKSVHMGIRRGIAVWNIRYAGEP
jgi:PAB-dependent poly(A)-specific ribonuclease subunit 2